MSFAGHPEGHPYLEPGRRCSALAAKRDWGRGAGVRVDVVSQFCFESAPILAWIEELEAHGLDMPVHHRSCRSGDAGDADKFALRCGVGNSLRSVRDQIGRFGRLLTDNGPDDVMRGLCAAPSVATAAIAGFHLFPFGGLRKTGQWLRSFDNPRMVADGRGRHVAGVNGDMQRRTARAT